MILTWDEVVLGCPTVDVEPVVGSAQVELFQSYPNPTNADAAIMFKLPATMDVTMNVVNIHGQEVAVLVNEELGSGMHEVVFNTAKLTPGVYYYNLRTNDQMLTKSLVVTK